MHYKNTYQYWLKFYFEKKIKKKPKTNLPQPFIAENAIVEEDVTLEPGVMIWHYCQIRPRSQIGEGTRIGSFTYIDTEVKIGKRCNIQSRVYIPRGVTIEDDVFLGPACTFTNDNDPIANPISWEISRTIVRSGVSIGANATILPGLEIGKNSLVGAGSVVTCDVQPNTVVVGNPARKIRMRK